MLDPLLDPLKNCAVVPQKYVEALERQGWVKPIRCSECKYLMRPTNLCANDGCIEPYHTFTPIPFNLDEHWCRFGEAKDGGD